MTKQMSSSSFFLSFFLTWWEEGGWEGYDVVVAMVVVAVPLKL